MSCPNIFDMGYYP